MEIILIRHGESEHNAGLKEDKDVPLTKRGIKQAEYVGKRLTKIKISKIYTSNLIRAKQTAQIISKSNKITKIKYLDGLNEYPSRYLGRRWRWLFDKRLKLLKKLIKGISKDKEKNKTILIVAHGTTNRILLGYFLKIPLKKQLLFFKQSNTGISVLHWSKLYQNWNLESMNDISHLPRSLK